MASSTDKNNLPRGKDSLSVIAAQAAKKKIGNDLLGGETTDSEAPESPPKKNRRPDRYVSHDFRRKNRA